MREIKIEDFNKLYETDPEIRNYFDSTIKAFVNIREKSLEECKKKYPQYQYQILQGLESLFQCLFFKRERNGLNRLIEWFRRMSDYIEKTCFPELKDPDFRNPIALESFTWKYIVEEFFKLIKEDPGIKNKLVCNLQQQPFYDDEPLAHLLEASMAGIWVSSEELSNALSIPKESIDNQADVLLEKGLLKEENFIRLNDEESGEEL